MQHMLSAGKLLNKTGVLNEAGYATKLLKEYNRADIKASAFRIKEWDYYLVTDGKYAVAFTIADNSYMALVSASFLDFENPAYTTTSVMKWFTLGKLALPSSSVSGNLCYKDSRVEMTFLNDGKRRVLDCVFQQFNKKGETLTAHFDINSSPVDSMVIAVPFPKVKTAFYYNQKINCMKTAGIVKIGEKAYSFAESDTLATLDWGRGVWTYNNTWYWSSLSTYVNGVSIGFNLGYGFGDTSAASENMIFYDGIAHKTESVTFHIPQKNGTDDFMSPWNFTSSDGRVELDFVPIIDRFDNTNAVVLSSNQHQVFGLFSGKLILDGRKIIELKNALGFAEKVANKW